MGAGVQLGWQPPDPEMVSKAVAAAKQADVAIVFAAEQMGEGQDKVSLPLPGDQNSLIDAVASANPRTIVGGMFLPAAEHPVRTRAIG